MKKSYLNLSYIFLLTLIFWFIVLFGLVAGVGNGTNIVSYNNRESITDGLGQNTWDSSGSKSWLQENRPKINVNFVNPLNPSEGKLNSFSASQYFYLNSDASDKDNFGKIASPYRDGKEYGFLNPGQKQNEGISWFIWNDNKNPNIYKNVLVFSFTPTNRSITYLVAIVVNGFLNANGKQMVQCHIYGNVIPKPLSYFGNNQNDPTSNVIKWYSGWNLVPSPSEMWFNMGSIYLDNAAGQTVNFNSGVMDANGNYGFGVSGAKNNKDETYNPVWNLNTMLPVGNNNNLVNGGSNLSSLAIVLIAIGSILLVILTFLCGFFFAKKPKKIKK